jgi:hypothetical protein
MTTTPVDTVTGRAPRTVDRLLPFVAALPVLVLGGLRAGDQAFWMDEGASRHIATLPFVDMLRRLWRDEAGMGPYYLALWVWRHLFDSEAGLRWLSVIGGAVAVALIVWLAVGWFGRNAAIVTALVMVMNPFFLRHLTEARAYTWTMAVSVGFTIAFAALIDRPTVWRVAVTASLAGLGIALHTVFAIDGP